MVVIWPVVALGLALGLVLALRALFRARLRKSAAHACPPGIEWSGYVEINGAFQWLLVRGVDAAKPLLLYLHGGPGWPETFLAGHRYSAELERHFVVAHWEQRGAGKSYRARPAGARLTNDQLLSDVEAVTHYLLTRYRREKLYLVGHSWGSLLGILAISKHPELYHAFIGVGQFVNAIEQERLSLHFCLDCLQRRGDKRRMKQLAAIGEPPYQSTFHAIVQERAILGRVGGSFGPGYSLPKMLLDVATFPHYGVGDLVRFIRGGVVTNRYILDDNYWGWALDSTHLTFSLPVCFFVGKLDFNTPRALAERYLERIEAPRKEMVVFESAAHMIPFEDPGRFNREVVRVFTGAAG